ncbi:hypothetical protein E4U09_002974 [Claviceps aff. purpurea]|uniref:Uncharacterized protein n=1 Tax=Claviceps aff. purpurea TaxID=1967640 RepID=A0A9P7QK02_9HYPO|nr:hypothetical protein E4U09_002974 [Claviceps aff. purpurea]
MQPIQFISVLSALAVVSQAAPTPETIDGFPDLVDRSNSCPGDKYFKCVTFYAQLCNTSCFGKRPRAMLQCLSACVPRSGKTCQKGCHKG